MKRRAQLEKELRASGSPERAAFSAGFFKTGKGQYAEGDRFLGLSVPVLRKTIQPYRDLGFADLERLLASPIHEFRLAAIEILTGQYKKGSEETRQEIFDFYLAHTARVNNWDLVDASAPYIVGEHLLERPRDILYQLAKSDLVWERRIAIVATMTLIRRGDAVDALRLSELLLTDKHDLMHKAVGWMLREVGKVDAQRLRDFLRKNAERMPRTALRYAIERFPAEERAAFISRGGRGSSRVRAQL